MYQLTGLKTWGRTHLCTRPLRYPSLSDDHPRSASSTLRASLTVPSPAAPSPPAQAEHPAPLRSPPLADVCSVSPVSHPFPSSFAPSYGGVPPSHYPHHRSLSSLPSVHPIHCPSYDVAESLTCLPSLVVKHPKADSPSGPSLLALCATPALHNGLLLLVIMAGPCHPFQDGQSPR